MNAIIEKQVIYPISKDLFIFKDPKEEQDQWLRRLVYSVTGRMMLASLWDAPKGETVSIQHVKERGRQILNAYQELLPEIVSTTSFGNNNNRIIDRIMQLYVECGHMYHKPNRVTSAEYSMYTVADVSLIKGVYATESCKVSGLGPYYEASSPIESNEKRRLTYYDSDDLLDSLEKTAEWKPLLKDGSVYEYLRTFPPFTRGYWVNSIDRNNAITLMRCKHVNDIDTRFCLCKESRGQILIADIPDWLQSDRRHVYLSVGVLRKLGVLPSIRAEIGTSIVNINIGYRLPPQEEKLWLLYSWPRLYDGDPHSFGGIVSTNAYCAIKELFVQAGYRVQEEQL